MAKKILFLVFFFITATYGQNLFEGFLDKLSLQKFKNESKDFFNFQNSNIFDKVNFTLKKPEIFPSNLSIKTPEIFQTNFTFKKPDIFPSLPFQKKKEIKKPKSTKALILEFLEDLVNCIEDKKIRKCTNVFKKLIKFKYRKHKIENKIDETDDNETIDNNEIDANNEIEVKNENDSN